MLKILPILFCLLTAPPAGDTLRLLFWNVENFFAPGAFEGHSWSKTRFYGKCNAVAKTILMAGDAYGGLPDVVGFAEVGDASVLKALLYSTPLRKLDYSFVHYDSPDHRGIDCALLYRRSRFRLVNSKPCHLYDSSGAVMPTRDILLAVLEPRSDDPEPFAVLVNHHPSKVGSGSGDRRRIAMNRLRLIADSLMAEGYSHIIAVGDFNDEVRSAEGVRDSLVRGGFGVPGRSDIGIAERLCSRARPGNSEPPPGGTIKFQGKWEQIDGCPLLEGLRAEEHIFAPPQLLTPDSYGGEKPRRTFSGPRYLGGVSDHLPVFYLISLAPSDTTTS